MIMIFFLASCEEPIPWDQQEVFPPRLVVDGMLTNQPGENYIRLSLPVTGSGQTPRTVSSALVSISTGDSVIVFEEDPGEKGMFYPRYPVRAVVNRVYKLTIEFESYTFEAFAGMLPVAPIKDPDIIQTGDSTGFFRVFPKNANAPAMTRHTVEWVDPLTSLNEKRIFYHYTLSTTDVNQFFKPASEKLEFPVGARIIRQQYSLTPDHERYIRSLLSETEWKGGWFDVLPGNLHTNLSTGGVGYFAASSMVSDTIIITKQ